MGCCGGNGAAVEAANAALNDMIEFATGGAVQATAIPIEHGGVRMEFIGDQLGAQTFYGKGSKLPYRAGREHGARFHNVDPRDVEYFLSLGLFRIVEPEPLMASAVVDAAPVVAAEPRAVARVKGRRV